MNTFKPMTYHEYKVYDQPITAEGGIVSASDGQRLDVYPDKIETFSEGRIRMDRFVGFVAIEGVMFTIGKGVQGVQKNPAEGEKAKSAMRLVLRDDR